MDMEGNMGKIDHYKKQYGRHYAPQKPDYGRCCEEVQDGFGFHQCSRKCGHGPDAAYCKQHDPISKKVKEDARLAAYRYKQEKERPKWYASEMIKIIRQIAEGHNDPRSVCVEFLRRNKFNGGNDEDHG